MFDRLRPCSNCPFKKGVGERFGLSPDRLEQIRTGTAFQCHKTVDYEGETPEAGPRPTQCAGLMAVLHREGEHNQIMQVATRFGALNPDRLDPRKEAYDSWDDVLLAHCSRLLKERQP